MWLVCRPALRSCRDKSYPEIARILALEGAQFLLTPHATIDTEAQRFVDWSLRICTVLAMGNGCYLIANNNIADWPFDPDQHSGSTFAIDLYGRVIQCDTGSGEKEKMALIKADTNLINQRRKMGGVHFNLWSRHPFGLPPTCLGPNTGWREVITTQTRSN